MHILTACLGLVMKRGLGNEMKHRNETEAKRQPFTKHENCFQELIALPNTMLTLMPRWKIHYKAKMEDTLEGTSFQLTQCPPW